MMKRIAPIIIVLALLVGVLLLWRSAVAEEKLADDLRIRQVFSDGEKAITGRNVRAAASLVSRDYEDNSGLNYEMLRARASQAVATASSIEVVLDAPEVQIQGHTATAKANVRVVAVIQGDSHPVEFPLTAQLRKEESKKYLVFPVTRWKITKMEGLPLAKGEELL